MHLFTISRGLRYIIFCLLLTQLYSSCSSTKYLGLGETLVKKNEIKIDDSVEKIKRQRGIKYSLSTLHEQTPNRNILFIPREYFWYKLQDSTKNKKIHNWQRRKLAEPPAIYDEKLATATAEKMKNYMMRSGYFDAEVSFEAKHKGDFTTIQYTVKPNHRYILDSINFASDDRAVQFILNDIKPESNLKIGGPADAGVINKEADRIEEIMRNRGYAYFNIPRDRTDEDILLLDTISYKKPKAGLELMLNAFGDSTKYRSYNIGKIQVNPQDYITELDTILQDTILDGIHFLSKRGDLGVRPKALLENIFLREGELYKETDYTKTIVQLGDMGLFQFIDVKPIIDSENPKLLNFDISMSPIKRMEFGGNIRIYNSQYNRPNAKTSLIGLAGGLTFRHRNLFKGAELLVINVNPGVELDIGNIRSKSGSTIFSSELGLQAELYFPKFLELNYQWTLLNKIGILGDKFYTDLTEAGKTRLGLSFNSVSFRNFYSYKLLNASFGYDILRQGPKGTRRYQINQIGINYFDPVVAPPFQAILDDFIFLQNSFRSQLFTGALFRTFSYTFTSKPNKFGESFFLKNSLELSGGEIALARIGKKTVPKLGNIEFSQYFVLESDARFYKKYSSKRSLAFRFNFGIARPFATSTEVPYVKQFSVGGPNSIRAWRVRELGPGGFIDPVFQDTTDQPFYQTGNLKLELNAEYRFDIFLGLRGAFFVDAGNVWTVKFDPTRLGSQFRFGSARVSDSAGNTVINESFIRQMAIGGGLGLRYDFSYFIIRLDMALKFRNPSTYLARDNQERYWEFNNWKYWNTDRFLRETNFNLAIGFPF